jgi:hypothetical protein
LLLTFYIVSDSDRTLIEYIHTYIHTVLHTKLRLTYFKTHWRCYLQWYNKAEKSIQCVFKENVDSDEIENEQLLAPLRTCKLPAGNNNNLYSQAMAIGLMLLTNSKS